MQPIVYTDAVQYQGKRRSDETGNHGGKAHLRYTISVAIFPGRKNRGHSHLGVPNATVPFGEVICHPVAEVTAGEDAEHGADDGGDEAQPDLVRLEPVRRLESWVDIRRNSNEKAMTTTC